MDFSSSGSLSGAMAEERVVRRTVRCAVYTRKSTEEGLDQEFNSLQAQREAAEAYIKSQRHLGWTLLSHPYDDGGFTGGNIERPALKRLLEDIEAHRVDCVMVYKVDRPSRSLLDFARLMDLFDQRSVSFVSVTQQFNTTTSLGRLTLNILLSFAQFEREIIGERTRDKMSAARRKGKWVGGMPVLGYDVDPRGGRLIVNEGEAARVREIFRLYAKYRSLAATVAELQRRHWTTKSWTTKHGSRHAGSEFDKATLLRLLTNAIYIGKVEHKGTIYPGEQAAIIEPELWEEIDTECCARLDVAEVVWSGQSRRPPERTSVLPKLRSADGSDLHVEGRPPLPILRVSRSTRERMAGVPDKVGCRRCHRGIRSDTASLCAECRWRTRSVGRFRRRLVGAR
jgi:DNA invertase Pin-like site-specific DNA recombinase